MDKNGRVTTAAGWANLGATMNSAAFKDLSKTWTNIEFSVPDNDSLFPVNFAVNRESSPDANYKTIGVGESVFVARANMAQVWYQSPEGTSALEFIGTPE